VIGLHRTSLFGKTDDVPKNQYAYGSYDMGFAIYISDGEFVNDFPSSVDDLKSIENHYFVGEITEEEAFTKQYGYNKFGYNHQRKISIPSKFLSKEKCSFTIKLANYYNFGEDNQSKYYGSKFDFVMDDSVYVIVLEYEKSEDGRVIITNFHDKRTGGYYK